MILDSLLSIFTDPSLGVTPSGGIFYDLLPVNYDINKEYVVFYYKEEQGITTLDKNVNILKYILSVQVISNDLENVITMNDAIRYYLEKYDDKQHLRSITFLNDEKSYSPDDKLHYKTSTYEIFYVK